MFFIGGGFLFPAAIKIKVSSGRRIFFSPALQRFYFRKKANSIFFAGAE